MDGKIEDKQVLGLLLRKASAGCSVKIISSDDYYDQVVPSLQVKTLARFRLHAKCIVIDGLRFFVGSQNLRSVSMDKRREVGMIAEDAAMAQRIERVFDEDWNNAAEMAAVNELKTT
jgi:phosphatidylserine/phosphatidylglycerophosphate/cardiolipin synthase-like enzyme